MFWSGDKLANQAAPIVTPFDPKKIDCSAYTLTLGGEYFVTPNFFGSRNDRTKRVLSPANIVQIGGVSYPVEAGSMVIPPGQFAYLLTEEFLKVPYNVMGFISLKSKVKWLGLINVSGFHVDPGFGDITRIR